MSKRKQDASDNNSVDIEDDENTDSQNGKGSTFVVTVVNDSIQGLQEWTEEETNLLKHAVEVDCGQFNWDVIASSVPSKDINQVKAYVLSMQQSDNQVHQSANVIKAPIEIWTDLAQKFTSEEDKAASVCLPQEEIYAVQTELREVIADQQNKLNKLFSSMRNIKKIVKKTKRQNRRKLAEQNAKIDTLISLLATNTIPNISTLSTNTNEKDNVEKDKGSNSQSSSSLSAAGKDNNVQSLVKYNSSNPVKHILPLITISGPDLELSPYSMVPIGQNPKVLLSRQQYNDAYYRGKNIRRFAVRLAEKVFTLDVLAGSTVSGQHAGLEKLCVEKLGAIRVEVMALFMPNGTMDEREAKWKECLLSIGKKCQVLRSGRALKQELLNPSSSYSDAEQVPALTSKVPALTSANEGDTAAQSISTPNVSLKVNEALGAGEQTPPEISLVPLGGSPSVLIQKEDLTEAVKRGKKATFLALRLAEKVFGYEVLLESTITGREGTEKLDNDKLMAIREEITDRFARDQPIELQEAIWKKCLYSISTKCKVLRAQKQNPDGIDYELQMANAMKMGGDLNLLANVTCPENQQEISQAIMDQAAQVGCKIDQQGLDGSVVEQEGDMVAQEGDIVTEEGDIVQQEDDMVQQEGDIVSQEGDIVEDGNHITEVEVHMEHEVVQLQQQEVTAMEVQPDVQQTIQIDQTNGLCEQHIQVGELVEQEPDYV